MIHLERAQARGTLRARVLDAYGGYRQPVALYSATHKWPAGSRLSCSSSAGSTEAAYKVR